MRIAFMAGRPLKGVPKQCATDRSVAEACLFIFSCARVSRPKLLLMQGKDLRAYAVERYMNSGRVRITEHAYRKTVLFKELQMNHLWTQLNSFVMGDREAHKRSDDLLDACVYRPSVAFREWPAE
jgi:hypothetical protein